MDSKIIELSQRRGGRDDGGRTAEVRLRATLEQSRTLVSTSLISVLFLVTFANNSLMSGPTRSVNSETMALNSFSAVKTGGRGPDAVATGTSDSEDELARRLARMNLKEDASVGRVPSELDKLTLGTLEGRYSVLLLNGKIRELNYATESVTSGDPKLIESRARFLEENRSMMPVAFHSLTKVGNRKMAQSSIETFELLNSSGTAVAKATFHMDATGRLLSMKVAPLARVAAK